MGSEPTIDAFVGALVEVFREVRRVLRDDGTLWLNLGDSYVRGERVKGVADAARGTGCHAAVTASQTYGAGAISPEKQLLGIPWRVAFALQDDGWILRKDIIWEKPSVMPESVTDRCTSSHEHLFHFAKRTDYFYDAIAIMEPTSSDSHARAKRGRSASAKWADGGPGRQSLAGGQSSVGRFLPAGVNPKAAAAPVGEGVKQNASFSAAVTQLVAMRNKRDVWRILVEPFKGAHFATMPPGLAEPCIMAGTSEHGCCADCGAPWRRVVEKGEADLEAQRAAGGDAQGAYHGQSTKGHDAAGVQNARDVKRRILEGMVQRVTVDWVPTCACPARERVACTVLDPFGGAGTTGLVADRLGRNAILVELSPTSAAMARDRILGDAGMFAAVG